MERGMTDKGIKCLIDQKSDCSRCHKYKELIPIEFDDVDYNLCQKCLAVLYRRFNKFMEER